MRTPLFNFVTIRNPQTIVQEDKDRYFVNLTPEVLTRTHYYQGLDVQQFTDLKLEIGRRSNNFDNLLTFNELKSEHEGLFQLYREIRSETYRASYSDLRQFVEELQPRRLNSQQEARLWDNFAHYLWADHQESEVEVITAILVANKFLAAYRQFLNSGNRLSEIEQNALRRVTNAKIVIPIPVDNRVMETQYPLLSSLQKSLLESAHDQLVAGIEFQQLERLHVELVAASNEVTAELEEQARSENIARETRLRETLETLNMAVSLEDIRPLIGSRLSLAKPIVRKEQIRSRLSPASLMAFGRIEEDDEELEPTINKLADGIEQFRLELEDDLEVKSEETFAVFGSTITSEERIPSGSMIVKAKLVGINQFDYYLTYYYEDSLEQLMQVEGEFTVDGANHPVTGVRQAEQQKGFQTFKLNSDPVEGLLADFNMTLTRAGDASDRHRLPSFQIFEIIPHFDIPYNDEIDDFTAQPPPLFGVNKLGIVDFRRVEQEIACYVAGEVSHIENIMASEYKEKVSRSLTSLETELEVTDEFGIERQSDTETADKLEMQSEASNVLNEETGRSFNVGTGVSVDIGAATMTANMGFNFNSASSREESNTQALQIAKSITNRIQEKITQKRTTVRRSKFRREFENTNKHGFDNREGQEHVVGIYRWVDKIYNNYVVNYHRRSMLEFTVPEPPKNFIRAQTQQSQQEESGLKKPKSPKESGLTEPGDLTRKNYLKHAARYGANVSSPPAEKINIARDFSGNVNFGDDTSGQVLNQASAYNEIEVPDGYLAYKVMIDAVSVFLHNGNYFTYVGGINGLEEGLTLRYSIGGKGFVDSDREKPTSYQLDNLTEMVPVSIAVGGPVTSYAISVMVFCELDDRIFKAWQLETYNEILAAYRDRLAEYESAVAEHEAEAEEVDLNPRFKQQMMETELKRLCIEMITAPFEIDVSKNHYASADKNKFHKIKLSAKLDKHASRVKFLEQAFDWHLMAYIFYPYFYSAEKNWLEKISMENTKNGLFEAFLKSGMGRVEVPIKPGFEKAVMYYLQTGEVWLGGDFVLDVKNDLYLSIADELNTGNEEFTIEETWQSIIPTDLTILQARSAALDAEGLPCNEADNRIAVGSSLLDPVLTVPEEP